MEKEKDRSEKLINVHGVNKYGMTIKTMFALLSVLMCVLLVFIIDFVRAKFDTNFFKSVDYWISFAVQSILTIFGMIAGQNIGDDINKNKANGQFRINLLKFKEVFNKIVNEKLYSYFDDWLILYQEKKRRKKMEVFLRDNGVYQTEVLDLEIKDLSNLDKSWAKNWEHTPYYDKYYSPKTKQSITYFLSYTEEQISAIEKCLKGEIKTSKISSTFFFNALNPYEDDVWETAAHSKRHKGKYFGSTYFRKIAGLLIISALLAGFQPSWSENVSNADVWLSLISNLFTLCTATFWGVFISYGANKIDIMFLEFKINMLREYCEQIESKQFIPKTIEQKAQEQYQQMQAIVEEEEQKQQGEIVNEQE